MIPYLPGYRPSLVFVLGAMLAVSLYSAPAANAQDGPTYRIIDLADALPFATTDSVAYEVNDNGALVGIARDETGRFKSILWSFVGDDDDDGSGGGDAPTLTAEVLNPDYYDGRTAISLSDGGIVVGQNPGTSTGWAWRDGLFDCVPLPAPCGSFDNIWSASAPADINAHDVFTGGISPDTDQAPSEPFEPYRAFFDEHGVIQVERLGTFEGASARGTAINDHGAVLALTGSSLIFDSLLYDNDTIEELPTAGGTYSWPTALNDHGFGVGFVSDPGETVWPYAGTAALWDTSAHPTEVEFLDRLSGFPVAWPYDINNDREIVGAATLQTIDHTFEQRALLWKDGDLLELGTLVVSSDDDDDDASLGESSDPDLWHLQVAYGINDLGWIVGEGQRSDVTGKRRAVLLIPVDDDDDVFDHDFESATTGGWTRVQGLR